MVHNSHRCEHESDGEKFLHKLVLVRYDHRFRRSGWSMNGVLISTKTLRFITHSFCAQVPFSSSLARSLAPSHTHLTHLNTRLGKLWTLCCACSKPQPAYKSHVNNLYPPPSARQEPQNLSDLLRYATSHPSKLKDIGRYLHKRIHYHLSQRQFGYVSC